MLNLDSGLVKPIYRLARPNQQHGPQAKFKPISFVKPQLGDSTLSFSFFISCSTSKYGSNKHWT